jgi:ParB family chromosome partitioning protein
MVAKRGGLGRNLSALLSHAESGQAILELDVKNGEHIELPVENLAPGKYQPRREMNEASLAELADSIKKQGLLQPLVVREIAPHRYEIIAGERRFRACQLAGMSRVPVLLRKVDDETAMAMALVENLQREDLNPIDEARAMHRLTTEFALTHQEVADILSKSRAAVSNYLRLLNLCGDVRHMLERGLLDMGHARCLLMLDENAQKDVAGLIVTKGLSVRETETLVAKMKAPKPLSQERKIDTPPLFERELKVLSMRLKTEIKLKQGKASSGTLVIHYEDTDALQKMLSALIN